MLDYRVRGFGGGDTLGALYTTTNDMHNSYDICILTLDSRVSLPVQLYSNLNVFAARINNFGVFFFFFLNCQLLMYLFFN